MPETLNKQDEINKKLLDLRDDIRIGIIGLSRVNDPIDLDHVILWFDSYVNDLKLFSKQWRQS